MPDTAPQNGASALTGQRVTLSPAPTTGSATVTLPVGTTTYTYTTDQKSGSSIINYTATVNAVNANGNGPNASTPAVAGGAPTASVGALTALPYNPNGSIRLTWTPVPNTTPQNGGQSLTGYNITWSSGGGPESAPFYVNGGLQSQAALGGLTKGVAYTFRVYANNTGGSAAGNGPAAVRVAVVPGNPTPVGTPTLSRPGSGVFGKLYLDFSAWDVGSGPPMTDYKVTCTAPGGTTVTDVVVTPDVQNTITGLTAGVPYTCDLTGRNQFPVGGYGTATVTGIGPATPR